MSAEEEEHGGDFVDEVVRPFLLTGGRTDTGSVYLNMETLAVATLEGEDALERLHDERRTIAEATESPISVAEIAVELGVPLGVCKVLVADMAQEGLLELSEAPTGANTDIDLLTRLIDGVRAL